MTDPWRLFPFPTLSETGFTDGSLIPNHPDCASCQARPCADDENAQDGTPKQCRYGITYARVDNSRLVIGVVASDHSSPTSRTRRRLRLEPTRRVQGAAIERAISVARELGLGVVSTFESAKRQLMEELKSDPEMQKAISAQFRRDAEENLNQSHDFLQLVKLVRGYAERLLHDKFPDLAAEDAAERLPSEGAIYFSTTLMSMKVDSLLFIDEINRAVGNEARVKIHPLILKYLRIYNWQARQKKLHVHLEECHAYCFYNPEALGAIVQGLLDNAVKYAPAGSDASIRLLEDKDEIVVSFISLGPRIEDDERTQIFMPRYRARAARKAESGGQGIGLATVKQISDALGLGVQVTQSSTENTKYKSRYETTFSIRLRAS